MIYRETKVYNDGNHYIAIPHTTRPSNKKYKPPAEQVAVVDSSTQENIEESTLSEVESVPFELEELDPSEVDDVFASENTYEDREEQPEPKLRYATRKELFEEYYKESINMKKTARKRFLIEKMRPYFDAQKKTEEFVEAHLERKLRNLICRRIRLVRKANMHPFNYFCTFTYDGKKHDEDSFRRKFRHTISNFSKRKNWRYIGVWERSPDNNRLHFHGIFYIPEGTMPGELIKVNDYNFNTKRRQITNQNTYFNERFGRSDFDEIKDPRRKGDALAYLLKYIEKTGEKIVYSKGLPQFVKSDIREEDIITAMGMEDNKLLLYDDFTCIDEGRLVGVVSPAVLKQLRGCN